MNLLSGNGIFGQRNVGEHMGGMSSFTKNEGASNFTLI